MCETFEMVKRLELVIFVLWYFVVLMIWPGMKTEIISNLILFLIYELSKHNIKGLAGGQFGE